MGVEIAGRMSRRKLVKDLQGNIIDLLDESDGGWIVRNRNIVNEEKWAELQKKEQDKIEASKAIAMAKTNENAPDRTVDLKTAEENIKKQSDTDKRIDGLESKLDKILKALDK